MDTGTFPMDLWQTASMACIGNVARLSAVAISLTVVCVAACSGSVTAVPQEHTALDASADAGPVDAQRDHERDGPSDGDASPDVDTTDEPLDGADPDTSLPDAEPVDAAPPSCIVSIVAGGETSCAVIDDGSLWCWGSSQLPDSYGVLGSAPTRLPAFSHEVRQAGLGMWHGCALEADDRVRCWGMMVLGASGMDSMALVDSSSPLLVQGLDAGMAALSVGGDHACVRRKDGTAWCWGANYDGELGDGNLPTAWATNIKAPVQVQAEGHVVADVQAGDSHSCARTTGNQLLCWGNNEYGQLGLGSTTEEGIPSPTPVPSLGQQVRDFAVGGNTTCAILDDGTVWCWGEKLGDPAMIAVPTPAQVVLLPAPAELVAVGLTHACAALSDETVWCWGSNAYGQLGNGDVSDTPPFDTPEPQQVIGIPAKVAQLSNGTTHTCVLTMTGEAYCWGSNWRGQVGQTGTDPNEPLPARVPLESCGHVGVLEDPVDAGEADSGPPDVALDADVSDDASTLAPPHCAVDVATGAYHTCAVLADQTTWCWGDNQVGQLGVGHTLSPMRSPVRTDLTGPPSVHVVTGDFRTCILSALGELRCWGYDNGSEIATQSFDLTPPATQFHSLSMREVAGCALDSASAGWCWNSADFEPVSAIPVPIAGLPAPLQALGAGSNFACGLTSAGEVWCFGVNNYGQVGSGSTSTSEPPTKVAGLGPGIHEISCGGRFTYAIDGLGDVWSWGQGTGGQLGDGISEVDHQSPIPIQSLVSHAVSVAAGVTHGCAVHDDGSLSCWGSNWYGQLANGTPGVYGVFAGDPPAPVVGLPVPVTRASCGGGHTCALGTDGSVWCWGWNTAGQVGDGTTEDCASPVRVIEPCSADSSLSI